MKCNLRPDTPVSSAYSHGRFSLRKVALLQTHFCKANQLIIFAVVFQSLFLSLWSSISLVRMTFALPDATLWF